MNIYWGLSLYFLLLAGHPIETTTIPKSKEVTLNWIQGNWKIYKAHQNDKVFYSRKAFRFFEDNTGFKGVNQRLKWKFLGNILELETLKCGKVTKTYWWASRNRDNNLVLTRQATIRKEGILSVQKIELELERIRN